MMNTPKRSPLGRQSLAIAMLLSVAGIASCRDPLLTEDPKTIIVADNLYTDLAGFEAGLNALYFQVRRERFGSDNGANNLLQTAMTSGTDNVYGLYLSPPERIFNEFGVRNNPLDGFIGHIFNLMYQTINAANTIVNRAENPNVAWTEEEKNRVVAEARLIRAWAYRHLTYLYGDVPLNLEEASGDNIKTDWVRTPRDSVRRAIINDLLFAEEHLPLVAERDGRVSRAVAQHYLAEMYLAIGEPELAEEKASAVTTSGAYSLITQRYGVEASQPGVAFMDQFKDGNANRSEGNTETLWTLQYAMGVPGGGASIMRRTYVTRYENIPGMVVSADNGGRGIGRLAITRWALNIYEPTDVRGGQYAIRRFYIGNRVGHANFGDTLLTTGNVTETLNNPRWPSTRKWDWASPIDPTTAEQWNDQPYIRLAETYLLLAEAHWAQGEMAEAAEAINVVRRRAGASEIDAGDVTLDFILDERSRELVTEEHRRYTLLRTGKWIERTRLRNRFANATLTPRDTLLPIPQAVIDANLTLEMPQNPGF